jgi:hypothetical protein
VTTIKNEAWNNILNATSFNDILLGISPVRRRRRRRTCVAGTEGYNGSSLVFSGAHPWGESKGRRRRRELNILL